VVCPEAGGLGAGLNGMTGAMDASSGVSRGREALIASQAAISPFGDIGNPISREVEAPVGGARFGRCVPLTPGE
jgi:hypothetical protein